jgi:LuxR family maltose regulon positive regulatory protein
VHHSRAALVQRVQGLRPAGICLVDAPPGYGASTLLIDVAGAHDGPVAWVSVPDEPRAVVWAHVLAALDQAGVPVEHARAALRGDPATFRGALLNALAAAEPLLLVLDDLDALRHTDLLPDLQVLVDSLPSTTRLLLRLEHDGVALRRAATTGRALHLGVAELALREDEAAAVLRRLDPDLPAPRVEALLTLTDGWIAALLAPYAPGAREAGDDPAAWLVTTGAPPLASVLLDGLPEGEREFVTSIAVTDTVTPALAALLVGCTDQQAAESIARLRQWGLLRRPRDAAGAVALHPLVAEYARQQAERRGPQELERLHRAAATWLVEAGEVTRAIDHVLAAGDLPWALRILESSVGGLLETGYAAQVHGWYERAPDVLVTHQHIHLLAAAWSQLLSGNPDAAQRRCEKLVVAVSELSRDASAGDRGDDESLALLQAETSLLQASLAWWHGRPEECRRHADSAAQSFADSWSRMANQVAAMYRIRARVWCGDATSARALLVEAAGRPGAQDVMRRVVFPGLQAALAVRQGQVRRGRATAQAAAEAARASRTPSVLDDADARLALARACLDLNEPTAAHDTATVLADQAARSGHVTYQVLAACVQAAALHRLGRRSESDATLGRTRNLLSRVTPDAALVRQLDETELRLRLDARDRPGAITLLRRLPTGPGTELLAARLAPRGSDDAVRTMRGFRPSDVRQSVEAQVVLAGALAAVRPLQARRYLSQAAAAAHSAGLLAALRGAPDELQVLAERVAEEPDGVAVAALLDASRPPPLAPAVPPQPVSLRLTEGETQMVATMRTHRSQRDLAEALGVSVNTVKTRLRRLYRKLGVNDREAALAVADAAGVAAQRPGTSS